MAAEPQVDSLPRQVLWAVAPAPENEAQPNIFQYVVQYEGEASPELTREITGINDGLEEITRLFLWSQEHLEEPKTAELPAWFSTIREESDLHYVYIRATQSMLNDSGKKKMTPESFHELYEEITQTTPNASAKRLLKCTNPEEIDVLRLRVRMLFHDVLGKAGAIRSYSKDERLWGYEEIPENITGAFHDMASIIKDSSKLLEDTYPKEPIKLSSIQTTLDNLAKHTSHADIKITVDETPLKDGVVQWSPYWIERLFENILQNDRRYANSSPLSISFRTYDGQPYIDIICDDEGPGFSEDILKNGFAYGKTGGQGQGLAMAFHAESLNRYGGELIPTNRVNEVGKIVGSRLTVRLPITSAPPPAA